MFEQQYGLSLKDFLLLNNVHLFHCVCGKEMPARFCDFDIALTKGLENIIGKQVWIFDCRNSEKDILGKPIRNISPTLVQICDVRQVKKTVYYSPICFQPVGENGRILKKVIPPFDNTGYRSFPGISVRITDSIEEARLGYHGMAKAAVLARMAYIQKETDEVRKWAETLGIFEQEVFTDGT